MAGKKRTVPGFGERLAQLRKGRGMTQVELARAIGVTQAIISKYENAAADPAASVVASLAEALGVSTDALLGFKPIKASTGDPQTRALWRRFQLMRQLPQRDQRAVIRLLNSLVRNKRSEPGASRS